MKKRTHKQELYFSSSNQDNEEVHERTRKQAAYEKESKIRESQIDQLSSLQVLEIFCEPAKFQELLKQQDKHHQIFQRFIWRTHYLLGQTILTIQKNLIDQGHLKDSLLLQNSHLDRIVYQLIDKAKQVPLDQDFVKIKNHINQFYRHSDYDPQNNFVLYSEFVKLSRNFLRFEMELNFLSIEEELRKKRSQFNNNSVNMSAVITEQYGQNKMQTFRNSSLAASQTNPMSYSNGSKIQSSMNSISGTKNPAVLNNQIEKGGNRKWSPTQQAIFCKIYSQTDSPVVCAQLMEKQAGPDGRWKNPNQIQDKMFSLVTKVFQKFDSLSTNNQYIKNFRENKKIVLESQQSMRKKIFRNIAIIYESMLNVSEEKKAVISQKILEVNRLCRDITLMK